MGSKGNWFETHEKCCALSFEQDFISAYVVLYWFNK